MKFCFKDLAKSISSICRRPSFFPLNSGSRKVCCVLAMMNAWQFIMPSTVWQPSICNSCSYSRLHFMASTNLHGCHTTSSRLVILEASNKYTTHWFQPIKNQKAGAFMLCFTLACEDVTILGAEKMSISKDFLWPGQAASYSSGLAASSRRISGATLFGTDHQDWFVQSQNTSNHYKTPLSSHFQLHLHP